MSDDWQWEEGEDRRDDPDGLSKIQGALAMATAVLWILLTTSIAIDLMTR